MTTTNKADRCVRTVKVSEERMARLALNDSVWKPNVATFRQKRKLHVGPQMACVCPTHCNVFVCLFFLLCHHHHPDYCQYPDSSRGGF